MDAASRHFLEEYLANAAPTGFETSGQRIWLNYVKPYIDEYFTDTYGTAVGVINPGAEYKVVIEAHADEISWFVKYISDDGYIYVTRNGGSDHQIAPSKRVNIHTKQGVVRGVFGWPAVHVRDDKNDVQPKPENIFIDTGCQNKEEVEGLGIHVGTVITFDEQLDTINGKYLVGRALDNRIGGFMIAEVARRLSQDGVKLPFGLYVVNAVQEEIGLRGAQMIAQRIKPQVAIITDVTHDTHSPLYNKIKNGDVKCGRGPVLTYGPAVHNRLLDMVIKTATDCNIAFQRAAVSRSTGTDTDSFAYSNEGVASALISLPLKYMHTTVETVHEDDVQQVIELMYQFLVQLPAGFDFRYEL
ncbi:MAG: M42 family metallopeptidase [Cytophagales bacterium]|nr:M42 family metallopeptidase [Cytophagales bacterium]